MSGRINPSGHGRRFGLALGVAVLSAAPAGIGARAQDSSSVYAVQRGSGGSPGFLPWARRAPALAGPMRSPVDDLSGVGRSRLPLSGDLPDRKDARSFVETEGPAGPPAPHQFCVRRCDGFYQSVSDAYAARASSCGPDADLYKLPPGAVGIESAIDGHGRSYAEHARAFAFRSSTDSACARQSADLVTVFRDPTLRPGDLVMTTDGLKLFRGGSYPFDERDFAPAAAARLSAAERRWVEAIDIASARHAAGISPALRARVERMQPAATRPATRLAERRQNLPADDEIQTDISMTRARPVAPPAAVSAEADAVRYVGPDLGAHAR